MTNKMNSKEYRDAYVESSTYSWLAYQIRALRKQRGWTQEHLAHVAKIDTTTIGRMENPDNDSIRISTLLKLASAFDIAFTARFTDFQGLAAAQSDLTPRAMRVEPYDDAGAMI